MTAERLRRAFLRWCVTVRDDDHRLYRLFPLSNSIERDGLGTIATSASSWQTHMTVCTGRAQVEIAVRARATLTVDWAGCTVWSG